MSDTRLAQVVEDALDRWNHGEGDGEWNEAVAAAIRAEVEREQAGRVEHLKAYIRWLEGRHLVVAGVEASEPTMKAEWERKTREVEEWRTWFGIQPDDLDRMEER